VLFSTLAQSSVNSLFFFLKTSHTVGLHERPLTTEIFETLIRLIRTIDTEGTDTGAVLLPDQLATQPNETARKPKLWMDARPLRGVFFRELELPPISGVGAQIQRTIVIKTCYL